MKVLFVTGMSGAGKTHALKALEDCGFEAIDNLPLGLLPALILRPREGVGAVAVGVDVRSRDFSAGELLRHLERLRRQAARAHGETDLRLLFLDADDAVLGRRFSETRRTHPLALDRPVADGITRERELLEPLKEHADLVIDTSELATPDLRRLIQGHYALPDRDLAVSVVSFSYARGLPREADLVLDVRFLHNPHYEADLRPLTGQDAAVGAYIECDPDFAAFFARTCEWLAPLLPRYRAEGKRYLTIAVGCTGGRHRSVYVAEKLASILGKSHSAVAVRHREL